MSRTYRQVPVNRSGFRHPKTRNQRRQLQCLKADALFCEYDISPKNRNNRHMQTEFDELTASSIFEIDYAS